MKAVTIDDDIRVIFKPGFCDEDDMWPLVTGLISQTVQPGSELVFFLLAK
jgi:hypothetical protein